MKAHKTEFIIANHNGAYVSKEYDFKDHYKVYNETPSIRDLFMECEDFENTIFRTYTDAYDRISTIDNYPREKV